jgi:hypothetical protein
MRANSRIIPIYTSRGDAEAYLLYPYIYNNQGEWIGWISDKQKVYSVHGHYVGWVTKDPRILRKMGDGYSEDRINIMQPDDRFIALPASVPLAPLMPELSFGIIDVLLDAPDLMPPLDFGELREDMD